MNNKTIQPSRQINVMDFRVAEGERGSAVISLNIDNLSNVVQYALKTLKINFGL